MVEMLTFEGEFKVTDEIKNRFDDDGFIVVKDLLDKEEIAQIWKVLNDPEGILKHAYETLEPDGHKIQRILYCHPGNDVTGIVSRSEKIVNACEKLVGGEMYHYHGKFILKNANEGGRHVWHQDYGYWYKQNLFPDMITVWMPLDKTTRKNSCLQLLKGSHKCGRIDHGAGSGTMQSEADLERIEQLKKVCPHLYCEMEPGDVLFQHCNLLHTSDPNDSDLRRWAFVACYNRRSNSSFKKHHHPSYTPLHKVPDSEIKTCRNYTDFSGKEFVNPIGNEEDRKLYSQYSLRPLEQET
ncbi:L-proline trans-4-hydroxylase-like [Ruditapes philippinarum]|uniref:L-proline trans-4-hydroxylase-like n=1 Tax=Ruditapes philippinarum TaxID=129788 RepID=UPI00295B0723|nr:L-proline trans-4-hydroxylase-like [Ruditapes philippinarum]